MDDDEPTEPHGRLARAARLVSDWNKLPDHERRLLEGYARWLIKQQEGVKAKT